MEKAGGDDVVAGERGMWLCGRGWWCSSKRLLELLLPGLPRARTLPVCGRGVIGPILCGQGRGGRNKGPRRIQNHGPKSSPAVMKMGKTRKQGGAGGEGRGGEVSGQLDGAC